MGEKGRGVRGRGVSLWEGDGSISLDGGGRFKELGWHVGFIESFSYLILGCVVTRLCPVCDENMRESLGLFCIPFLA